MKVKKILFVLLLICCSLFIVHAEQNEVFKYDWTKKYEYEYSDQSYYHNKVYYDGGYIVSDLVLNDDEYATKMVKYDLKGEVVKEKKLSDVLIFYLEVHDDYIYAIGVKFDGEDDVYFVAKMNFDFEIENEYIDEDGVLLPFEYIYYRDYLSVFAFKDEKIFLICDGGFLVLNKKFKKIEFKSVNDMTDEEYNELIVLYWYSYERYEELYDEDYYTRYFDIEGDVEAYILFDDNDKIYLRVYKDDKELFTKRLSSILFTSSNMQAVKIVNNYVLLITNERISIYDLSGNKVQTIYIEDALEMANIEEDENYYYSFYNLVPGNNSFIYSICEISVNNEGRVSNLASLCTNVEYESASFDTLGMINSQEIQDTKLHGSYIPRLYDQVWYLPINVLTKSDGNGQIEVVETARYGDKVTFKVTPNKGYVLKAVKVTDSAGEMVVFTDNTFTVPNSDVTIEVSFVPENPDTSVGIVLFIILFVISSGATIIYFHSKYKVKEMS